MRVTGLRLVNFRNYPSLSLRPDAGLCVLTGENAAGKTNVLESLFLCSLGRSHRTIRDAEMIRAGESFASVAVDVDTRGGPRRIECKLFPGERKKITIDGSPIVALEGTARLLPRNSWKDTLYREVSQTSKPVNVRLIPYYAWGNRGKAEMTVWMPLVRK